MKFKYIGTARLKTYEGDLYAGVSIGVKVTARNTDLAYDNILRGLDIPGSDQYWEVTWTIIEGLDDDER